MGVTSVQLALESQDFLQIKQDYDAVVNTVVELPPTHPSPGPLRCSSCLPLMTLAAKKNGRGINPAHC